jgi:hypothetical protein
MDYTIFKVLVSKVSLERRWARTVLSEEGAMWMGEESELYYGYLSTAYAATAVLSTASPSP